jgi:hypothetical protein
VKTFRLASIALQAEKLRWRSVFRRHVMQAALFVVAGLLAFTAFLSGHLAVYALLLPHLPPAGAAGVVAGGDLVLALMVLLIAMGKSSPGRSELEAHEVSRNAQDQIRASLNWTRMAFLALQWFRSRKA